MKQLVTLALGLFTSVVAAQPAVGESPLCGNETMKVLNIEQINNNVASCLESVDASVLFRWNKRLTVPVVVHIVWGDSSQYVTDEQVRGQIQLLNERFRRAGERDSVPQRFRSKIADMRMEFVLARLDPNGNATTGITRTKCDSGTFFVPEWNDIKLAETGGHDAWDTKTYLNIWVGDIFYNTLGYAQFPGGDTLTDGVVIDYTAFGITDDPKWGAGTVTVHELGHWLGLYHIWGDDWAFWDFGESCYGSDFVDDTPNQNGPNRGCPTDPKISCDSPDNFNNYMDYVNSYCMQMFTHGQKARAWAVMRLYRKDIYKQTKNIRKVLTM